MEAKTKREMGASMYGNRKRKQCKKGERWEEGTK